MLIKMAWLQFPLVKTFPSDLARELTNEAADLREEVVFLVWDQASVSR